MPSTCPHLADHRENLLKGYGEVVKRIVYPAAEGDFSVKSWAANCKECKRSASMTMCCCLSCATFGCVEHMSSHFNASGHLFAVSTEFGHVFCSCCKDFVYDWKVEKLRREAENTSRRRLGLCLRSEWNPSSSESRILRHSASQMIFVSKNTIRGLRGLVNLGNTCFMNCIIQAFTHIPHLRDYFLTDQHICNTQNKAQGVDNTCLMCELSNIFQEFYNGEVEPFIPQRMLHLVWRHAKHMAGYKQHDAHEFFLSALDVLHSHSGSAPCTTNPTNCQCIIERIFAGCLQSDLTCMKCGRISTTLEPFYDISLELVSGSTDRYSERTLEDCLANYVKCEQLGLKLTCVRCETEQEATKQLSLKTLPMIACFHLKRFEHTANHERKKIESIIRFPEQIDLTPYTTAVVKKDPKMKAIRQNSTIDRLQRSSNRYELLAVVNHNGGTDSGHYSCYVRHQPDQWFWCNDMEILRDELESVLGSEGYLLFYTKTFIDYD